MARPSHYTGNVRTHRPGRFKPPSLPWPYAARCLTPTLRRRLREQSRLAKAVLSYRNLATLVMVYRGLGTIGAIARELGCSEPEVTAALKDLQATGVLLLNQGAGYVIGPNVLVTEASRGARVRVGCSDRCFLEVTVPWAAMGLTAV